MRGATAKISYGFASGRVRVLQTRLLSRTRLHRIVAGETLAEIVTALGETDYGAALRGARDLERVEELLDDKLEETYRLLEESNLPGEIVDWFRCRHDFTNLRILLKSGLGRENHARLSRLGTISTAVAQDLAKTHTFAGFPAPLAKAAFSSLREYERTGNIEAVDIAIDRSYFDHLLFLAGRVRSPWVEQYTRLLIDLANGRIMVRSRAKEISIPSALSRLVAGGSIAERDWENWAVSDDLVGQLGKRLPVAALSPRLTGRLGSRPAPGEYDLLTDAAARTFLATADLIAFGPEPVFAYAAYRELEVKLLRTAIIGRVNGVSADVLLHRVDAVYE